VTGLAPPRPTAVHPPTVYPRWTVVRDQTVRPPGPPARRGQGISIESAATPVDRVHGHPRQHGSFFFFFLCCAVSPGMHRGAQLEPQHGAECVHAARARKPLRHATAADASKRQTPNHSPFARLPFPAAGTEAVHGHSRMPLPTRCVRWRAQSQLPSLRCVSRLHSADTHVRIDSERRVRDGLLGGGVGRPRQRVPGRIPDACAHRIGSAHPPGAGGLAGRAGGLDLEGSRCPCYAMLLCAMPCPPARTIRRSAPKLPVTANLQPSHSRPYALDPTTTTAAGRTLKIVLYVRMYALYVRGRRQSRWAAHNHGHSPPPPPTKQSNKLLS